MITSETIIGKALLDVSPDAYTVHRENSSNGLLTQIRPINQSCAQMSIWTDDSSSCDIVFGEAFATELNVNDETLLLDLAGAVIEGRIYESIWTRNMHRVYSKSSIELNGRTVITRQGVPFLYPSSWKKTFRYVPY